MKILRRKKKQSSPFTASLILDLPEMKVAEARWKNKTIFFGVGVAKQQTREITAKGNIAGSAGGAYQSQREYEWTLYYNPKNLPDFMPLNSAIAMMGGTFSFVTGSSTPLHTKEYQTIAGKGDMLDHVKKARKLSSMSIKRLEAALA